MVYDIGNNYVLKVFPIESQNDPSYQFIRLASNNQNNPYFPKIKSIKIYDYRSVSDADMQVFDDIYYYNIDPKHKNIVMVVIEKLHIDHKKVESELSRIINRESVDGAFFRRAMNDIIKREIIRKDITDKQFTNALRLLEPLFRKFDPDLHLNNIMIRSNGSIVLSDPVAPVCSEYSLIKIDFIYYNDKYFIIVIKFS